MALIGHFIWRNRSRAPVLRCAPTAFSSSFKRLPDVKPGLRVVASHTGYVADEARISRRAW